MAIKATQSLENTDWMHISISKKEVKNKYLLLKEKHRLNSKVKYIHSFNICSLSEIERWTIILQVILVMSWFKNEKKKKKTITGSISTHEGLNKNMS